MLVLVISDYRRQQNYDSGLIFRENFSYLVFSAQWSRWFVEVYPGSSMSIKNNPDLGQSELSVGKSWNIRKLWCIFRPVHNGILSHT